jgi:hypothetical protein
MLRGLSLAAASLSLAHTAIAQAAGSQAGVPPWAAMAGEDLQAIHDLLAANHPGPVDRRNRNYAEWLETGLAEAKRRAQTAVSYGDYVRALRFYLNGFRDGHIFASFTMSPNLLSWPGFLVRRFDADGKIKVAVTDEGSKALNGAELLSCDGKPVEMLMQERLDPYFWNRDIPHARWRALPNLFVLQPSDSALRFKTCTFAIGRGTAQATLQWVDAPRQLVLDEANKLAPPRPPLGLRKVGDIWFVTLPSFDYAGAGAGPIRSLIGDLKAHAADLRKGTIVLDVRGNGGGNSAWAEEIASALWGNALAQHVIASFDQSVDWRASPANIARLEQVVAQNRRDGLADAAASWQKALDAMKSALARGATLARVPDPPTAVGPPPANPVTGRVYLLTDAGCASACLDFADIVRRMPGTTLIGLPTSADTLYVDVDYALLPSGLAGLTYAMKVYRNRVRGNNQWYEPDVRWPGGAMTDEALIRWIDAIPRHQG